MIAANKKDGGDRPIFTIKENGKTVYAKEVEILGPSKLVYRKKPLSCGANSWIVTHSEIVKKEESTFSEVKEKFADVIDS